MPEIFDEKLNRWLIKISFTDQSNQLKNVIFVFTGPRAKHELTLVRDSLKEPEKNKEHLA